MIYSLLKPLLFRLDPERAHELVTSALRLAAATPLAPQLLRAVYSYSDPILQAECAGMRFTNPLGLAAGFDKRAALIEPMALLGFGHIEVGTVTPRPQPGNPQPRLFRLPPDGALINRMGFNSPGMLPVARRLRARAQAPRADVVVGVNIGKNKATPLERAAEDYVAALIALAPLAEYVAINISSPNTPGLRQLHERSALEGLLAELTAVNARMARPRPLFLKISPDETPEQIEMAVEAGCAAGIAGFIATNTTVLRAGLVGQHASETGGLSGRPLKGSAQAAAARIARLLGGRLPLIGVGGIASAEDAYLRIRAGASLLQLYTGMIYAGPDLVCRINRGLAQRLRRDGFTSLAQAVGADLR